MITFLQQLPLTFKPISTPHPSSTRTHKISPRKISTFPQKPAKTPSLIELCREGNLKDSFALLGNMITDQNPSQESLDRAYSLLLELCSSKKALSQGKQIHTHVVKSNFVEDLIFLSTKIVFMYGRCGSLRDAEKVFDEIPERTIYTWNAMVGAYVGNGELLGGIGLYQEMQFLGVDVDAHTFPIVLKACAGAKDLEVGSGIHGLAIKLGFVSNVFVVNSLVDMYANCDDVDAALKLFDRKSSVDDVVSWNSMISAYCSNGMGIEALRLFVEMQIAGVAPTTYTLVAALQACEEPLLGEVGLRIHAIVLKSGYYFDAYVANALMVMYIRNSKMDEAERVFDSMDEKNTFSWNTMLSGYVQNGFYHEAFCLFREMNKTGQEPHQVSLVSMLAASGRLGNLLNGMEIHAVVLKLELESELQIGNTLVDMYVKCSRIDRAESVFKRMPYRDYISWTTMISGYANSNHPLKALELFRKVQEQGLNIDALLIGSILLACSEAKNNSLAKEIHGYVIRRGLYDLVIQKSLVNAYGECDDMGYACSIFELIEIKDVVSFTSMILCYVRNGLANEALELVLRMKTTGIEPDQIALLVMLGAAADLASLRKGKEMHGFSTRKGFMLEGSIASALVDMYASCGDAESGYKAFTRVRSKDLVLWTSMIKAYGMHGRGKESIDLFTQMEEEDCTPDHITFLALLHACSHSGLAEEGKRIFEKMQSEYKLDPWPQHYACLVDILSRVNRLEEAFQVVEWMKTAPPPTVWCALLSACRVHGNIKLGEIVARRLLELEPDNPGNYVLASNVYAAAEKWREVEEVRLSMKQKGLKKDPACSWIEVGNQIHTFIAHDKSHPESEAIHEKLARLTYKLEKEGGYAPRTELVLRDVEEAEKVRVLYGHSERLAMAYGLLSTRDGTPIRVTKNLRVCSDCHAFTKLASRELGREIIVRDANRFHHFRDGVCSCGDFW